MEKKIKELKAGEEVTIIAVETGSRACTGCVFEGACNYKTLEEIGILDCENLIFKIKK